MLNIKRLSSQHPNKATSAAIMFVLLIFSNCGKRQPPLPPIERVSQRIEISGVQRGNTIVLAWSLPDKNAPNQSIQSIKRADIYRLAESSSAPSNLTEAEFASRSTLISSVPITESDFALEQFTYKDVLQFAGQPAKLRYAVRFVNEAGQKAAFSNFLLIEPTAKSAEQPTLTGARISQERILITWNAPQKNVDGSHPVNIIGYNVYRTAKKEVLNLNSAPITVNSFDDLFFEFGGEYQYFVRTVSLGGDGEPVESLDSNILAVKPLDTFPPDPPTAVTIAAAPKNLSIFFAFNLEKDVSGYRIYRTTDSAQPKSVWSLITPEILPRNTFQDTNVQTGTTYYYYLTAVDSVGNVSEPSDVVSETAP